jgi:hypothetical protein
MVVGAGLHFWVIDQISVAAHDAYRERFLDADSSRAGSPALGLVTELEW